MYVYVCVQICITKFNLILFYTFKINHLYKHLDLYELFGIILRFFKCRILVFEARFSLRE